MPISEHGTGYSPWGETGFARNVLYSRRAVDEILAAAMDALYTADAGSTDACGILLGERDGDLVRIAGFCPFSLDNVEQDLQPTLKKAVGWYRSSQSGELLLSEMDGAIYERFFPEPGKITMLLRPGKLKPAQARLFFREPGGSISSDSSPREFETEESRWARNLEVVPDQDTETQGQVAQTIAFRGLSLYDSRQETIVSPTVNPPRPEQPTRKNVFRWKPILLIAGLIALAAIAAVLLRQAMNHEPVLSLKADFVNDRVLIEWTPVQNAQRGWLEFLDGGNRQVISLGPGELRKGSASYQPKSDDLLVRLKVSRDSGGTVEEVLRVLGTSRRDALKVPDMDRLRSQLKDQSDQSTQLEHEFKDLEERAKVLGSKPPRPLFQFPPAASLAPGQQARAAAPSSLPAPPSLIPASPQLQPQSMVPVLPPPAPVAVKEIPKPAPVPTRPQPTSGKLIWTGTLGRNGILQIEGSRVSTGHLNGELPKAPIQIGVYSAELTARGLLVYTGNAKYRDPARATDAPGPQNGWNKTTFIFDPKHANDVVVTEAPGPQNNWSRLVLRGEAKSVPVIVLEWQAVQ